MRASRSWPRSSVPNGCFHDGPSRRAPKSISFTGSFQIQGPAMTAITITARISVPRSASWWRRKRRHASERGGFAGARAPASDSTVGDAGVEPAIEQVGDEVEEDHEAGEHEGHRHDHRRVVGEDRADEERADARHAEDL